MNSPASIGDSPPPTRERLGILPITLMAGISLSLVILHLHRLIAHGGGSLPTYLFRDVGPLVVSVLVIGGVYWVHTLEFRTRYQVRIFLWYAVGVATFGSMGLLIGFVEHYESQIVATPPLYLIVNTATAGAGVGVLVGAYDAGRHRRDDTVLALHSTTQALLEAESAEAACQIAVDAAATVIRLPVTGMWLHRNGVLEPVAMSRQAKLTIPDPPTFEPGSGLAWDCFERSSSKLYIDPGNMAEAYNSDTIIAAEYIVPIGDHGVLISGTLHESTIPKQKRELTELVATHVELVLDRIDRTQRLRDREQELAAQNDRLDQFTSVVSHDLRNPLNVIAGYLHLARTEGDTEAFDRITEAIDRMETLLDDLLALARSGEPIRGREPIDLAEVARMTWNTVDTGSLTLAVDPELGTVSANESRLSQLFANLFRNTVVHADGATGVWIEKTPHGFAIEDDGSGVPATERNLVFNHGFSKQSDGTGLGLTIVSEVVDGHGWSIELEGGKRGGARFVVQVDVGGTSDT